MSPATKPLTRKRGRGRRKKGNTDTPKVPLVSQGIPHLSLSFITSDQDKTLSTIVATKNEDFTHSSAASNSLGEDSLALSLSQGICIEQQSEMAWKNENKEANMPMNVTDEKAINLGQSDHEGKCNVLTDGKMGQAIDQNTSYEQVTKAAMEDKTEVEKINNSALLENNEIKNNSQLDAILNVNEKSEITPVKHPLEDKENLNVLEKTVQEESKVEFISVYSSEEPRKKVHDSKISKEHDQRKEQSVPIGPLQPVLELVDPCQLDQETEKYYKEVGSLSLASKNPTQPKCLTPGQIVKITRECAIENEKSENSEKVQTAWNLLHQYWTFVQENPYDFDGWTYLLNHVDTMDNIEAARSAYEGFLPLYPYCYAYWMKLSNLELKFSSLEQALGVLYIGTKCVPFCTELWAPLLNKFLEYAMKENISEEVVRGLYEFSLQRLGLSWQSSSIWDVCINYELAKGDLVRVMYLYRRLLSVPTKLYNRHWDHLLAVVRDYHPRNLLTIEEYSILKKSTCDLLKIKFNPPLLEAPKTLLKVTQSEDKIHTTIKEKIVAALIPLHEANERECEKRWKFEEKIKRPYFHVKPLEKKQVKTWRDYLDFEMKEGDPVRIVTLFERCLVPCAMYEEFWCKYASFMEDHVLNVLKNKYTNIDYKPGLFTPKRDPNEPGGGDGGKASMVNGEKREGKACEAKEDQKSEVEQHPDINSYFWHTDSKSLEVSPEIKFEVTFLLNRLSEEIGVGGRVLTPPSLTPNDILHTLTWEDVRQIYRRAAWIHCPSKPLILMQWAEFEEAQENIQTARELLNTVIVKYPKLLKARIQLIELERRSNEYDRVKELYAQTFNTFTETRIRSCIAIRYARFLSKIQEDDDKALLILRKALKKDKGNIHLYHHVFDVCYQRRPIDNNGVLASVMLALASKELTFEEKYTFCIKRSEFLREHGTMAQFKEAKAEMEEIKRKLDKERSITEIKKLEEEKTKEKEENTKKELEENQKCEVSVDAKDSPSAGSQHRHHSKTQLSNGAAASPARQPAPTEAEGGAKEDRSERRKRRRDRDGSSERRHKKKSSRSSKKDRKSKRSRRHRKEGREEGELKDDDEETQMDEPNEDSKNEVIEIDPSTQPPHLPNMVLSQHGILPSTEKPYQTVPPSWDLNAPMMSYRYNGPSELNKENQNILYERYYELINKGYDAKERERANPSMAGPSLGNVIEGNDSYLPPPPMPQGILGESLFSQDKMETPRPADNSPANLMKQPPPLLPPPPTAGLISLFSTRLPPPSHQQTSNSVENQQNLPNLHVPPPGLIGHRMTTPLLNPALLQTKPPSLPGPGIIEAPQVSMPEVSTPLSVAENQQNQVNLGQKSAPAFLSKFPNLKLTEREGRGRGNRGRDRVRSHPAPFNQQQPPRLPMIMGVNVQREISGDGPPYVNVPDWLVNEGGELRLSETPNGDSIIRYWPRYISDKEHEVLFQFLRTSVNWFQPKQLIGQHSSSEWSDVAKLVSWIGPCNYEKDGMFLPINTSWPQEILDLLHRLISFSNRSFNSCFMNLYTSGHSYHTWHSECHKAMSKNPTTACVSLGITRTLEMKRTDGSAYLRFPLFPGSLFVMEGATHSDWLCQIPKEPHVKAERISLSFRTMLMIKGVTV